MRVDRQQLYQVCEQTLAEAGFGFSLVADHLAIPFRLPDDTTARVEKVSRAVGATVPELIAWEWAK